MIGLCGAHRTGKTTLAEEYAQLARIPFVRTSTSEVFRALGFDPKVDYDFKIRMMIQNGILDAAEALWKQYTGEFVTDRTPIDMLAYTMADVQRQNLDKDDEALFIEYMNRCIASANKYFALLVAVQPGIPLVEAEVKAPNNMAYIEHINSLVLGLVTDGRMKSGRFIINRKTTDLTSRCDVIDNAMNRVHERHKTQLESGRHAVH